MNLRARNLRATVDGRIQIDSDRYRLVATATVCALLLLQALSPAAGSDERVANKAPRLVVQITVDALRGDLPRRFAHMLGDGGFRYLMEQGIDFTNAHYEHAITETIVGHVSLATGTTPSAHGMVGNVWFDRALGRLVYNIEDADYHLLSSDSDVDKSTEIDPTQKAAGVEGRSPRTILSTTFSDELAAHYAGQAKIFGISIKDRGAVSLAGQYQRVAGASGLRHGIAIQRGHQCGFITRDIEQDRTDTAAVHSAIVDRGHQHQGRGCVQPQGERQRNEDGDTIRRPEARQGTNDGTEKTADDGEHQRVRG